MTIAFETSGSIGPESLCFLRDLGRCLRSSTREPQSLAHLLRRLSVAVQVGNSTSVMGSIGNTDLYDYGNRLLMIILL